MRAALLVLVAAAACARVAWADGNASTTCKDPPDVIVIGQSAGTSQIERAVAAGLRAAYDDFKQLSALSFDIQQLNHSSEAELLTNVKTLALTKCAFVIAATTGRSGTEPQLLKDLKTYGVPLVGTQSASQAMRNVLNLTMSFLKTGATGGTRATTLPYVVNVRASGYEELSAVLSVMAQDWENLSQISMVTHNRDFGHQAYQYVNDSIGVLTDSAAGVLSNILLEPEGVSDTQMTAQMESLFAKGTPKAIIICTTPNTTAQFLRALAKSSHSGFPLYFVSWVSPEDLVAQLGTSVLGQLAGKNMQLYFTQNMPDPAPAKLWTAISLIRKFSKTNVVKTRAALEGYLVGWFIYEAAQEAAARNGLPLRRGDFLNTVFVDVRTFNVQGMTLGPYGDGGISGGTDTQSESEACNQGVHDMYMTQLFANGSQTTVSGGALKFAGCTAPKMSSGSSVTLVGSIDWSDTAAVATVRSGLLGAINSHNSEGDNMVLLRSMSGDNKDVIADLQQSSVVALARPELAASTDYASYPSNVAVVSPMPGYYSLRRPFQRRIINLFPSAYDETVAAIRYLRSLGATRIAALRNDNLQYTDDCVEGLKWVNYTVSTIGLQADPVKWMTENAANYDAVYVMGGTVDSSKIGNLSLLRVFNSEVNAIGFGRTNNARAKTFTLSVSPPLAHFATTSDIRTQYSTWVSSTDTDGTSFQSFFIGKFLAAAIDSAKGGDGTTSLTADTIINAIYKRSVFTVGGVQVGPFRDSCSSSSKRDCCNTGLKKIYVVSCNSTQPVVTSYTVGDCGRDYMPPDKEEKDDNLKMILGLAIGLGGGALLCVLILSLVIWRAKRTVEFFNIRRGEIELGQCLGNGRFGSMYMADWHGTPVAVRVIDKKATPKEDQRLIKEEVLLLHKHHHPNLLMLMGYCETKTDILVVTEYMEGGTLADYIRKEKRYASVYALVGMAFDVLKGIAYLHSCKPPIVHGSICTHNLLLDGKGSVKVSDFWFSSKKGAFSSSGSGKSLKRAAWQPPEVIAGTFLTPATDVYAFGIVLWELIAPPEMTASSSASASESQSSAASSAPPGSSGMLSVGMGGALEMNAQLGPPEIPPNASPEVSELFAKCWQSQPERRPSVFQILRNWPTTFAALGAFEVPQDLIPSVGSANAAGLFSHQSSGSGHNNPKNSEMSGDDLASIVGIMPLKMDSVALQMPPQNPDVGLTAMNPLAGLPDQSKAPAAPENV
eukprot:m51a1_g8838 putative pas domain-containing protein tyrosine kinase (1226) ;mRNA; r:424224-428540